MRRRTGFGALGVLGVLSFLGAGPARAAEVTHFSANGSSASHNSFDGTASLDLTVNRNDSGQSSTTNLFFNKQTCDNNGCSGILGFGTIPNGDLTIGGGAAKLNTNLAAIPGYQVFSYVNDFVNSVFTQTPITGGIIIIDWKLIPRQSTSSSGTASFVSGAFSVKQTGSQSSDRAKSTGSFFGAPIPTDGFGLFGTTRSSTIQIIRN
jgi:hypothetical protein